MGGMSVNISASALNPRVCRPTSLTAEVYHAQFSSLQLESGWNYFTVSKQVNKSSQMEIHCLRIPQNGCCNIINEMQWYCRFCNKFPCQWRARARHLKKCKTENHNHNFEINLNPHLLEIEDPDMEELNKIFETMGIKRFCDELS